MAVEKYQPVSDDENDLHQDCPSHIHNPSRGLNVKSFITGFLVALALSLSISALLFFHGRFQPAEVKSAGKSQYAGLERNVPIPWHDSDFASHNRTILDNAWATLDDDIGVVSLKDKFTVENGLPTAQRWPWDESKGLYLLQAYHNIHCLKVIRTSLMEMHDKMPQSVHFRHVSHCLDAFRQDIMCNADDTPRYTGPSMVPGTTGPTSGLGQVRMCRSWDELEKWAKSNSACYVYEPGSLETGHVDLDYFKHCPDGSKPWRTG